MFIGTVMHAIDHRNEGYMIDDRVFSPPRTHLLLQTTIGYVSRKLHTSVDRPPCRMFESRFSHAGHPLYLEVYNYVLTVNPRLAGYMEACIGI
jgi:hypothetical protein